MSGFKSSNVPKSSNAPGKKTLEHWNSGIFGTIFLSLHPGKSYATSSR
jgi:hypothetical protein